MSVVTIIRRCYVPARTITEAAFTEAATGRFRSLVEMHSEPRHSLASPENGQFFDPEEVERPREPIRSAPTRSFRSHADFTARSNVSTIVAHALAAIIIPASILSIFVTWIVTSVDATMESHSYNSFELTHVQESEPSVKGFSDDDALVRIGRQPVLKRNFGFMSILGFSCTVLITWEGSLFLFGSGMSNGGPAGVIYGFLLVWIGTLSVFATLSELASMAPTSGGQYHWVAMLAPPSYQKFLCYITGWLTLSGWQAVVASGGFLCGTMIQSLIVLTIQDYTFQSWHGTLFFWAVIVFAIVVNSAVSSLLPKFEGFILILHITGFFAILIPLVVLGPHDADASNFTTFFNEGGWPTQGLSFCVGLIGNVFAFFGADAAIHMSEEIKNAPMVVPRSIITALMINGALGFAMVIGFLYSGGDLDAADDTTTAYPFMVVFYEAVQSTTGAALMTVIVIVLAICAEVGSLASASRVLWSFARDRGVPWWSIIEKVDSRTAIPVWSIAFTTGASCCLALINIGSSTAFNDVVSVSIVALFSSYLIVAVLLLWRRVTGVIKLPSQAAPGLVNTPGAQLVWGPWRLPGLFGVLNNAFSCVYLITVFFFSFWPATTPVTPATMNYSAMMLGATMIFSLIYYGLWGRRTFTGPIVQL